MVTALLSTTPRQVPRSSTDDSVLKNSRCVNSGCNSNRKCKPDFLRMLCHQVMGCVEKTILWPPVSRDQQTAQIEEPPSSTSELYESTFNIVAVIRRDSDLEAFSHNPTDGSFAPLIGRSSTWTKCPNLRFLSYWAGFLSQRLVISRVKLTCLTTV